MGKLAASIGFMALVKNQVTTLVDMGQHNLPLAFGVMIIGMVVGIIGLAAVMTR